MNSKRKFQILCVTMKQKDFSKIEEMNIHSDVIFANQSDTTAYDEKKIENHIAKMITTKTRGVGINRNLALCYADADICLLADDDVKYYDGLEEKIISEFEAHPDADVFIFHLDTDSDVRKLCKYSTTHRIGRFGKHPWGAVRIAFRLNSVRKSNIWFSALFGGGAKYSSGEDSLWIDCAYRAGLCVYVSHYTIGIVNMQDSSWFSGFNQKYYFSKGAFYMASYPKMIGLWMTYFATRTNSFSEIKWKERMKWMHIGAKAYLDNMTYEEYIENIDEV